VHSRRRRSRHDRRLTWRGSAIRERLLVDARLHADTCTRATVKRCKGEEDGARRFTGDVIVHTCAISSPIEFSSSSMRTPISSTAMHTRARTQGHAWLVSSGKRREGWCEKWQQQRTPTDDGIGHGRKTALHLLEEILHLRGNTGRVVRSGKKCLRVRTVKSYLQKWSDPECSAARHRRQQWADYSAGRPYPAKSERGLRER
jgi:hypothetical protein